MGASLTSPSFHLRSVKIILVSSVKFSPTFTIRVAKTPVSPSGDPPAKLYEFLQDLFHLIQINIPQDSLKNTVSMDTTEDQTRLPVNPYILLPLLILIGTSICIPGSAP